MLMVGAGLALSLGVVTWHRRVLWNPGRIERSPSEK